MRVGIFGAGQAGVMVATWLKADQQLICYIDNKEEKQGQTLNGIPICSLNLALEMNLDLIWIAVLNEDATKSIKGQLEEKKCRALILDIQTYREQQDIRLAALRLLAKEVKNRKVAGAVAELGVYRGAFAAEMNRLFPDRRLYLFDTFEGFSEKDLILEPESGGRRARKGDFSDTSIALVRKRLPNPEQAIFVSGYFPNSIKNIKTLETDLKEVAVVSLDTDLYEPTYQGLTYFYPRLSVGGMILIHDYNSRQFPGVGMAVRRFCEEQQLYLVPLMDLHGTAVLIKQRGENVAKELTK